MRKPVKLTAPKVFIRVRPQAEEGGHAQFGGTAAAKMLNGWDESSVNIGWTCDNNMSVGNALEKGQQYDFEKVLPPEVSQNEVYDTIIPPLVDKLLGFSSRDDALPTEAPTDCLFFAYGQTGTGKTHTTVGPDASLRSAPGGGIIDERWGCFPRIPYNIFERLRPTGRPFVVSFSACEFYLAMANDLLMGNSPVAVSLENQPIGLTQVQINEPEDIIRHLITARAARHTRQTKMNLAKESGSDDEHSGSSRGHAMFILTVRQIDPASNKMVKTTFNLVDLAGAERPDKTGAERKSGSEVFAEFFQYLNAVKVGKEAPISIGAQAFFINYELYSLCDTLMMATDYNKTKKGVGRPYKPSGMVSTDAVRIMGRCFAGSAHLGVIVTLSQAPQCGWETWFSCNYASTLAKLKAPVKGASYVTISKAIQKANDQLKEDRSALDKDPKSKVVRWLRIANIVENKNELFMIRELCLRCATAGIDVTDLKQFDLPGPATTGFTFDSPTSLQHKYTLQGEWNSASLEEFVTTDSFSIPSVMKEFSSLPMEAQRNMVDKSLLWVTLNPGNRLWTSRCPASEKVVIDTSSYPPCDNPSLTAFIHRPHENSNQSLPLPAVIHCHGGGATFCCAQQYESHAARYALDNNVVVFNLEYRLAPETKAPGGIFDAVGMILYLRQHGASHNIDPNRIAIIGDSGGGYIAAGAAFELARRDESDALKLCVPVCPMVSDIPLRGKEGTAPQIEGGVAANLMWGDVQRMLTPAKGISEKAWVWVAKCNTKVASKFPPTVIITAEFDMCRRMAEELAAKLTALEPPSSPACPLLDYIVHPNCCHSWHYLMDHPLADNYWGDIKKIFERHL